MSITRQDVRDMSAPAAFGVVLLLEQLFVDVYTMSYDDAPVWFIIGAWFIPFWYLRRMVVSIWEGKHRVNR